VKQIDERLPAAMLEQLAHRPVTLAAGTWHLGWKLGVGQRESIGRSIVVGHLTSATRLAAGARYRIDGLDADLRADAEPAVELGRDLDADADANVVPDAISSYGVALEIRLKPCALEGHVSVGSLRTQELVDDVRAGRGHDPLALTQTGREGDSRRRSRSSRCPRWAGCRGRSTRRHALGSHQTRLESPPPREQGERMAPVEDTHAWQRPAHEEAERNRPPTTPPRPQRPPQCP
jgi:hypothetical protein